MKKIGYILTLGLGFLMMACTDKNPATDPTVDPTGVTASGTAIFNSYAYYPATVSGGSNVTLSNYSSGGGMGW